MSAIWLEIDPTGDFTRRIAELWLSCYTEEEIAEQVSTSQDTVNRTLEELRKIPSVEKCVILSEYQDPDWTPPLYNVWKRFTRRHDSSPVFVLAATRPAATPGSLPR